MKAQTKTNAALELTSVVLALALTVVTVDATREITKRMKPIARLKHLGSLLSKRFRHVEETEIVDGDLKSKITNSEFVVE